MTNKIKTAFKDKSGKTIYCKCFEREGEAYLQLPRKHFRAVIPTKIKKDKDGNPYVIIPECFELIK